MPLFPDSLRNLSSALIVTAIIVAALYYGSALLIPFAAAILIAFILSPIVNGLTRLRVPRTISVVLVMVVLIAATASASILFSGQMLTLAAGLDDYRHNVMQKVRWLTSSQSSSSLRKAAETVESLGQAIDKELTPGSKETLGAPIQNKDAAQPPRAVDDNASYVAFASSLTRTLVQLALALLFTLFLLLQHRDLRDRLVRVVGTDNIAETTAAMSDAGQRLSRLLLAQALLNGSFGVLIGAGLAVIGIPNPALWGFFAGLWRFVPFIGSFLAAVPPLLLAAAVDPGWSTFLLTAAIFIVGEPIMGHIVEPQVLGRRVGLSPLALVLAASFWTLLWGPIGLLLAAPLTMALAVVGNYVTRLEFLSVLLGDDPPLSPEHEFYHRLLAEDAIAATQQVESALEASDLAQVSDSIVLPALRMAALDHRKGRLEPEQLSTISATLGSLIPQTEQRSQEKQKQAGNTLVIAGRGPVDLVAAQYIAAVIHQVTAVRSVKAAKTAGLTALSDAQAADDVPPDIIVLVSVGGLDLEHIRFVVQRAHRIFSGSRIIVVDEERTEEAARRLKRDLAEQASVVSRLKEAVAMVDLAAPESRRPEMSGESLVRALAEQA